MSTITIPYKGINSPKFFAQQPESVDQRALITMIQRCKMNIIDFNPPYQRGFVWDREEKEDLTCDRNPLTLGRGLYL
jgi:hypothetical protein